MYSQEAFNKAIHFRPYQKGPSNYISGHNLDHHSRANRMKFIDPEPMDKGQISRSRLKMG